MRLIKTLILACLVLISVIAVPQNSNPIPMDPAIRHGVLENGLTYYIKQNKMPENRAEFYLAVNAGAIQETPGQNGLAHFTEHMCFNGTKNFEKKEIINYLQSIGMKFGPEINAYTITDRTVYTLQKVPIETKENIDTSLMILYDWATHVDMVASEIDAERGVIREEFRTRMNGMRRMMVEVNKVMYEGSKYAIHDVIGQLDVIDYAPYDTLRAFYNEWYRPDLQAIIVVGDFNLDEMEAKVKGMFSKIPARKVKKERMYYEIPGNKEPKIVIAKDKEARSNMIQIVYKHPAYLERTEAYYRYRYMQNLYETMLNNRMAELIQSGNPPFTYGYSGYNNMLPRLDAYLEFAVAGNDQISTAIQTLLLENQRVLRYGFLETELERAKKDLLKSAEKAYNERNKVESEKMANNIMENYLSGEPIPSDDWDFDYAKKVLGEISLADVNGLAGKWITDENMVVAILGLDAADVIYPTEAEILAMIKDSKNAQLEPYIDKVANRPLISKEITNGKVVSETKQEKDGITRWTLSNGVKVVIKPTDYKDDEILLQAHSLGGWSQYAEKDDANSKIAADVVDASGLGDFDNIELQKYLSGKNVSLSPYIGELTEGFSGRSTQADFETMLELVYMYFVAPRADKDAFDSYIKRTKSMLKNKYADPSAAFSDSLNNVLNQYNTRYLPTTEASLDAAKLGRIKSIFQERFGDPSGFTFYFVGNIDPEKFKPLIEKYLGGLPQVNRTETFKDLGKRLPEGIAHKAYQRKMETPKATVFISFNGKYKYTIQERLMLEAIAEYLDERMLQTLREEQGGTYGASVYPSQRKYPVAEYYTLVYFDCDPAKMQSMVATVYSEVKKMQTTLPDQKVIDNIIENKIKEHKEKVKNNRYWLTTMMNDDFYAEDMKNFDYEGFWKNLKAKDLQKASKKYLTEKKTVQVIMSSEDVSNVK